MSDFSSHCDLIKKINNHLESSDNGSLSSELDSFINDEFDKERGKIAIENERRMEEVDFHNLTTAHNISKLWEVLHPDTIIKRGRKSKKPSLINVATLETLKSSVKNVTTGFEAPPNPVFSIGGYVIPADVTFKGVRKGRKSSSLKNYSFPEQYRAALNDAIYDEFASSESVKGIIDTNNVDNNNINENVDGISTSINMLENDQYDNTCYYIDLYKKKDVQASDIEGDTVLSSSKASVPSIYNLNVNNSDDIKDSKISSINIDDIITIDMSSISRNDIKNIVVDNTIINNTIINNNIITINNTSTPTNSKIRTIINNSNPTIPINTSTINNIITSNINTNNDNINVNAKTKIWREPVNVSEATAYIPPKAPMSYTMRKKLSKPGPIVERIDVHYARLRSSITPIKFNDNCNTELPLLVNNSIKLESGTFISSLNLPSAPIEPEEPVKPVYPTKLTQSPQLSCVISCGPVSFQSKPVAKVGRPLGSPNKTPEQREQERLNKRPKGRPRGSKNKKSTNKTNDEVIIYDNEIPLRINPNRFEVHMIQYTLENPHVSFAEWTNHSNMIMDRIREENKVTLRQRLNDWEKNVTREINRIKGRLSLGRSRNKGKGKLMNELEPEDESAREALGYKYELLETRKNDPFYISLLKQSLGVGSSRKSRKSRFDDIGSSRDNDSDSNSSSFSNGNMNNNMNNINNSLLDSNNVDTYGDLIQFTECLTPENNFVDDLIDLSNVNINNLYVNNLLEKIVEPDVIDKLLNNVIEHNDNKPDESKKSNMEMDDTMKLCLSIYQCVYAMYSDMK